MTPADMRLPTLLGSFARSRNEPEKSRRPAPAALDILGDNCLQASPPAIRVRNTFIESADAPSSLEAFDTAREVRTCPSQRIGCLGQFPEEEAVRELGALGLPPPLPGTPCGIRTPCALATPSGEGTPAFGGWSPCRFHGTLRGLPGPWPLAPPLASAAARTVVSLADALGRHLDVVQTESPKPVLAPWGAPSCLPPTMPAMPGHCDWAGGSMYEAGLCGGTLGFPGMPQQEPFLGRALTTAAPPSPPAGPAPGSSELPSMGSGGHTAGQCKPCAFLYTKGCENGLMCQFCHLCEPGEKNRRKKEKLELRRASRKGPTLGQVVGGGHGRA